MISHRRAQVVGVLKRAGLYAPAKAAKRATRKLQPAYLLRRRRMRDFYRQFVRPGSLCFDIGAHMGNRTEVFLALGAAVVAVEPQPACAKALRSSFGGDPRFTLVPAGVSDSPGVQLLLLSSASTVSTMSQRFVASTLESGRLEGHEWTGEEEVPVTTLDALIAEHGRPDFVKIDVEGYELHVLDGLSTSVPAVSFEFTPEVMDVAIGCVHRLTALGDYEFNHSVEESMRWASPGWRTADAMVQTLGALAQDRGGSGDVYARLR